MVVMKKETRVKKKIKVIKVKELKAKEIKKVKMIKTSRKWLTVAIFRKWQDSSVALWIKIAVILDWR